MGSEFKAPGTAVIQSQLRQLGETQVRTKRARNTVLWYGSLPVQVSQFQYQYC